MLKRKALNTPPRLWATVTAHYYREGWANILPDTTSKVKAQAIMIEYE